MDLRRRGVLLLLSLFALITLIGTGSQYIAPATPVHAQDPGEESFTQTRPARLYVGDPSHALPANANPNFPLNGYCIEVQSSTHTSVGPNLGFSVIGGVIVDDVFAPNPTKWDNSTPQTNDDIYCVIVQGLPGQTLMTINWNYTDTESGGAFVATLEIPLVEVTLKGFDGVVGGRALVCTVGWDATILTGNAGNVPGQRPDPLDSVTSADWEISPALTVLGVFKDGTEWCIAVGSSTPVEGIDAILKFDAVYNVAIDADDRFDSTNDYHFAQKDDVVNIIDVWYSELRHITIGGQIAEMQMAEWNVASSRHTACIIPSGPMDIFLAKDIVFLPAAGEEALPDVSDLRLFTVAPEPGPGDPPNPDFLPGVVTGTWCFTWTSHTPGEQAIYLTFTKVGGQFPGQRFVSWDSNGDGNPDSEGNPTGPSNGALVKKWNRITRTDVTLGNNPLENVVTNGTTTAGIVLAVGNGTYVFQNNTFSLTEWVYGSHRAPNGEVREGLLDGVILVAKINGLCGHFVSEEDSSIPLGRVINGVSVGGRFDRTQTPLGPDDESPWNQVDQNPPGEEADPEPLGDGPDDLRLSITGDPACRSGVEVKLQIDAYYPSALIGGEPVLAHTELVDIRLTYVVNQKSPRVAWAGQIVSITYGFAAGGGCGAASEIIHFVKQADAPGNFLPDGDRITEQPDGFDEAVYVIGNDEARTQLGPDCSATVRYESEQEGEVDVEAFLESSPFSKIAYPIYYLAIEDVTISASPETVVSAFGDLSATVRGYFTGSNPSGRAAETKEDGRRLPADRWVLPDDWNLLKGPDELRPTWPASVSMPLTNVTFFMANEGIVNDYRRGVFSGGAGFFILDGTESSLNVNPRTGEESILGSFNMPRIITDLTDDAGVATVDTWGDFNLGYNDCTKNAPTGNPHCDVGDVVGQSQYYAIADYPAFFGQLPPVRSPNTQTSWLWAGFKTVTVEDSNVATQKYVVVRLRDRDGFCDAVNPNNVLGIPIKFRIDAGDGKFVDYKGLPVTTSLDGEGVIVTSFDTEDDRGNPLNVEILRPIMSDTGDECQAWVKVSRSLPGVVNVEVTIPDNPAPPPGDIRFTNLVCTGDETLTVKNFGSNPVSLEGYGIKTPAVPDDMHLGLTGILQPGQSKTFQGGPHATDHGWIFNDDTVLADNGGQAILVWDNRVMGSAFCNGDGTTSVSYVDPVPTSLPFSGEGELHFSVNVTFGNTVAQNLVAGWNLIGGSTSITPVREALTGHEDKVDTIYAWDNASGSWKRYFTAGPEYLNTLESLEPGVAYWVFAKQAFTLSIPE